MTWADGMAPALARLPAAAQITEEGGEEASLLGSLAPENAPAPPPPAALQCHFKPLTGEVCIGEAPPSAAEGQEGDKGACRLTVLPTLGSAGQYVQKTLFKLINCTGPHAVRIGCG